MIRGRSRETVKTPAGGSGIFGFGGVGAEAPGRGELEEGRVGGPDVLGLDFKAETGDEADFAGVSPLSFCKTVRTTARAWAQTRPRLEESGQEHRQSASRKLLATRVAFSRPRPLRTRPVKVSPFRTASSTEPDCTKVRAVFRAAHPPISPSHFSVTSTRSHRRGLEQVQASFKAEGLERIFTFCTYRYNPGIEIAKDVIS